MKTRLETEAKLYIQSGIREKKYSLVWSYMLDVDTERFISMVKRDTFDDTEWQRERWGDKSIDEIHALATEHEKNSNK